MRKFLWSIVLWVFYKPIVTFGTWLIMKLGDNSDVYEWAEALTDEANFLLKLKHTTAIIDYLWNVSLDLEETILIMDADEIQKRYNYETNDINEFLFVDVDDFYRGTEV